MTDNRVSPLADDRGAANRPRTGFDRIVFLMLTVLGLHLLPLAASADAPPMVTVQGSFDVSPAGAATYTVPLMVPPGTGGMSPALSLSYSSQSGDGYVGLGWSLNGLPSITHCARTVAQDGIRGDVAYNSYDAFCLAGHRLIKLGTDTSCTGGRLYRNEIDDFSKILACGTAGSAPAYFKVWTRTGQIMELGFRNDARVLIGSGEDTIRVWAVDQISDTLGNNIRIHYTISTSNSELYPSEIDYTARGAQDPYNSVQFVYGYSPTSSGLRMLPLMGGLLVAAIASGRAISRIGRYKMFPIAGTATLVVGMYLLSRLSVDTAPWLASVYMAIVGVGIGLVMQVLVLVVQNDARPEQIGVATSTATFFRSVGGSFGVAIFGAIFASRLADQISGFPANVASHLTGGVHLTPEQANALPPTVHEDFLQAFAHSLHGVFLFGMVLSLVPFVLALFLKEVPLRTTVGRVQELTTEEAAAGGTGVEAIIEPAAEAAASR